MADNQLFVQNQSTTLAGAGASLGATSVVLSSFTQNDGTLLTMANFGSKGFATIEPGNGTQEEAITFSGVTQNADGTATLTGVKTQLTISPYTESSGLAITHAGGTVLVITNTAGFYNDLTGKNNDETVTGTWTFTNPKYPRMDTATPPPIDDEQLATKKYVDDTAGGTPISINRIVVGGNAGETVVAGNAIYLDETDNEWKLTDANASSTSENVQLGIAQGAGTNGNPIGGGVLLVGRDSFQSGGSQGDPAYLSDTAGLIQTTPGTKSIQVGTFVSATEIDFTPYYYKSVSTKDEKNALVGNNTSIAVGTGNKYVTQTGLQVGAEVYAADAGANDTYVITLSPAPTAYATGMQLSFKANTANTGASTLNVNTLGAITIKKNKDQDLESGDIKASQIVDVTYDGTNFQMQSQTGLGTSHKTHIFTTDATLPNNNTETTLMTFTLSGNALVTNNGVQAKIYFSDMDVPGRDLTVRLKYGATTIATAVATNLNNNNYFGYIEAFLAGSGATNTQKGVVQLMALPIAAAATSVFGASAAGTGAEDSTGDLTFVITAQWSVAPGAATTFNCGYAQLIR